MLSFESAVFPFEFAPLFDALLFESLLDPLFELLLLLLELLFVPAFEPLFDVFSLLFDSLFASSLDELASEPFSVVFVSSDVSLFSSETLFCSDIVSLFIVVFSLVVASASLLPLK